MGESTPDADMSACSWEELSGATHYYGNGGVLDPGAVSSDAP